MQTASNDDPEAGKDGRVEVDPASQLGSCPGNSVVLKIDNLRSGGTFGPITISNFTSTSFTWTSTQVVNAVLVKDGGGISINAGGMSGSATSLGQDISFVIFCLGQAPPPPPPSPPPPPPPCVDNPNTPRDECNPPQPCVDNLNTPRDECAAPEPPDRPDDRVGGEIIANVDEPDQREPLRQVQPQTLPFTGAPIQHLLWLALLLQGAGALLLWRIRDRGTKPGAIPDN